MSGYFANVARVLPDGSYVTIRGNQIVHIHPNSILNNRTPEWILYHEVVETTKIYLREVSVIQPEWLTEIAPHFYQNKTKAQLHQESHALTMSSIEHQLK